MSETETKTLAELAAEVDEYCQAKGWREEPISFGEAMALLHTEIAEASDAWRHWGLEDVTLLPIAEINSETGERRSRPAKPEGVGSEFADIFIRLLDDSVLFGVDLDAEMTRHAGKFLLSDRFLDNTNTLHTLVARVFECWLLGEDDYREWFAAVLVFLRQLCELYGIDLQAEYVRKMEYNRLREYRHGDKRR